MAPPLFSSIGKSISDLLDCKKFSTDREASVTTKSKSGKSFSVETGGKLVDSGVLAHTKISTCGLCPLGSKIDVTAKTNNTLDAKVENKKLLDNLTVIAKAKQDLSGSAEVQYQLDALSLRALYDINNAVGKNSFLTVDGSAKVQDFLVGVQVKADVNAGALTDAAAAAQYKTGDYTGVLKTQTKLSGPADDAVSLLIGHKCTNRFQLGAKLHYNITSAKSCLAVGTQFDFNADTSLRERIASNGDWAWRIEHKLYNPNVKVHLAGTSNIVSKDPGAKFGFGFAFGDY